MRRRLPVLALVLGAALTLAGVAAGGNGGLGPVSPASPNTQRISDAYWVIAVFTGAIFVLVEGLLVVFIVRFRSRGRPRELEGPQIRGHTRLELAWTAAPVLILAIIGVFVFYKLPGIKDVPEASAADRVDLTVEGRQFYWQFEYPNGAVSIDRLRAPAGKVVAVSITAPTWDVIHSWWIPQLHGKFDAIPGQTNHTWFKTSRIGTYEGECAEFCGIQHARMYATVEVVPAAEYEQWVDARATATKNGSPELGKEEWEGVCLKCHRLAPDAAKLVGPNLGGNPLLADAKGLETLVRNGRGDMPAVAKGWSDGQMRALVAYLKQSVVGKGGSQSGG